MHLKVLLKTLRAQCMQGFFLAFRRLYTLRRSAPRAATLIQTTGHLRLSLPANAAITQTSLSAAQIPILGKERLTFSAEMIQICHGMDHFHASKIHQTRLLSSRRRHRYALSGAKLASKI